MGIFEKMKHAFKRKDEPKTGNKTAAEAEELKQVAVSLGELVSSLDKTAQTLAKSKLDDERKKEYLQMLIDMKSEISGIPEAKTIPALPEAMGRLFSESLTKIFEYGSAENVEKAKLTVFEGIKALPGTKKEQMTAVTNLNIQIVTCEIVEGEYLLKIRVNERNEAYKQMSEDLDDKDRKDNFDMLALQVNNLKERNKAAQLAINTLIEKRRDIEDDVLGTGFLEAHKEIEKLLKSLPSVEEKLEAIENVKQVAERDRARRRSEIDMLARALGGLDDEELAAEVMGSKKQKNAREDAYKEAVEQKTADADAQMETAEE